MQHGEVFKRSDRRTWTVRWYDATGVRHTKGGWRTRAEAVRFLNDQVEKVRLGIQYRPDRTFDDLAAAYEKQYTATAGSKDNLRYALRKASHEFGHVKLIHLTALHVSTLRASIPQPHARFRTTAIVKQVLAAAVAWRWIDVNPAASVKNPVPLPPEIFPFQSWAEIDAIVAELEVFSEIPILAAGTGLRTEEWAALQKRDIDLEERVLHVRRVWVDGVERHATKTMASQRRVPLRFRVVEVLEPLVAKLNDPTDALLPGQRGKYMSVRDWRENHWHPAVEAAGLLLPGKKRRLYDLRHTYASFSLAALVSVFALARRMGTSVRMIDGTYGHLVKDADEAERKLLDTFDES